MGDLQPLGSEKLQGMEKINRILELSKFRENIPSSINETSRNEYKLTLADGNEYQIVKEKSGYIIKKTISESTTDYIEPMKNRKYFSSYSQALKKLNLMAKETNVLFENNEGINLFSEQKKFVLKTPRPEKKNSDLGSDIENVPPPPSAPTPPPPPPSDTAGAMPPPPPSDDMGDVPPMPTGDETAGSDVPPMPSEDESDSDVPPMPSDDEMGDEMGGEGEDKEEVVTFKTIQKLTGRLGQKLRALESQGEEPMSSKDIKYVINSILSALNLDSLEEDDKDSIINKFEGGEEEESDMGDDSEEDMGSDEMGSEEGSMPEPEEPQEMTEEGGSWADLADNISKNTLQKGITPFQHKEMGEEDGTHHVRRIADEMFVENKVENILTKYFLVTESEKRFNNSVNQTRKTNQKIKFKEVNNEIKRLSENVQQEIGSKKFFEKNRGAKLIGKTNKNSLVFEIGNKQFKISTEGKLI